MLRHPEERCTRCSRCFGSAPRAKGRDASRGRASSVRPGGFPRMARTSLAVRERTGAHLRAPGAGWTFPKGRAGLFLLLPGRSPRDTQPCRASRMGAPTPARCFLALRFPSGVIPRSPAGDELCPDGPPRPTRFAALTKSSGPPVYGRAFSRVVSAWRWYSPPGILSLSKGGRGWGWAFYTNPWVAFLRDSRRTTPPPAWRTSPHSSAGRAGNPDSTSSLRGQRLRAGPLPRYPPR